jgi:hypothetical protein
MKKTQKMGIFDLYNALKRTWHAKKQKQVTQQRLTWNTCPASKQKVLCG